ncbi:flippase-like domain-containing protein [archaeon]|nr:MAG: flippase-like domain-containing protein [archaeon]
MVRMMRFSFIRRHSFSLSLIGAIATLGGIVYHVGISEIVSALTEVDKGYLAVALLLYAGTLVFTASRWATLIRLVHGGVHRGKILQFTFIDKFANAFFPTSAVGMAARSYLLQKEYGIPKSKGFATIVLDYGVDIVGTLLLAIPSMFILRSHLPDPLQTTIGACISSLAIATVGIVVVNRHVTLISDDRTAPFRWARLERLSRHRLGKKVFEFVATFRHIVHNPRRASRALGYTAGVRCFEAVRMMVLFKAFGMSVPVYYFILFETAWFFIAPFMATPGGIGAIESGRIAVFSLIPGMSTGAVAPVVFVDRFITFWLMVAIGAAALALYNKGAGVGRFSLSFLGSSDSSTRSS